MNQKEQIKKTVLVAVFIIIFILALVCSLFLGGMLPDIPSTVLVIILLIAVPILGFFCGYQYACQKASEKDEKH